MKEWCLTKKMRKCELNCIREKIRKMIANAELKKRFLRKIEMG
jgi:hypothetical protein